MIETSEYYVVKLFSIEFNKYSYLYANNPYRTIFIASRYSSYEEGFARMQEFFKWGDDRRGFDINKSKVVKITLLEEDM